MKLPGFSAQNSLGPVRAQYWPANKPFQNRASLAAASVRMAQSESDHAYACAQAWQNCVWYGICDWYYANCLQTSRGATRVTQSDLITGRTTAEVVQLRCGGLRLCGRVPRPFVTLQ